MQRLMVEPGQVEGDRLCLSEPQQHYLYRVLRLGAGQRFVALDGRGRQWQATLSPEPSLATLVPLGVEAGSEAGGEAAPITLAIALPKGNGFDDVVRQVTELGVGTIQPVISDRTLAQPSANKLERWRRIAAEATEQSERLLLPQILAPVPWRAYLGQCLDETRWICVARGDAPPLLAAAMASDGAVSATIATGPEGGWTPAEVEAAIACGFQPVSLGGHILRAVTAPGAAMAIAAAARAAKFPGHIPGQI